MPKAKKKDLNESDKDGKSDKDDKSDIKEDVEKYDKQDKKVEAKKSKYESATFVQRLCAYIIDLLLIGILGSFIAYPFTNYDKIDSLKEKQNVLAEKFVNNDVALEEYAVESANIVYSQAKYSGPITIVNIAMYILYYVVFQIYCSGQTIGKKLLGIRVISTTDEDLTMNQMIFRTLIANSVLLDFLSIIFIIFLSKDIYISCFALFSLIQNIIIIISIFTVMFGKEGLAVHDRLCHTKVISVNK